MNRNFLAAVSLLFIYTAIRSQPLPIKITFDSVDRTVTITANGAPFATFLYPDTLEKPVLYPIYAPDGQLITRGFPLAPRPGEPTDHPHHLGLWFNYENVNGLDFWNNSYAIPAEKKKQYGRIRTDKIIRAGNETQTTVPKNPQVSGTAVPSPDSRKTRGVLQY